MDTKSMEQRALTLLQNDHLMETGVVSKKQYPADSIVIAEGDMGNKMYLVLNGSVRVSSRIKLDDDRGISPGLCDLAAGEIFGEMGLYDEVQRSATVKAVGECELLEIDSTALSEYMDNHPDQGYLLLRYLYRVVCERLRKADERMGSIFAWGLNARGIAQHL